MIEAVIFTTLIVLSIRSIRALSSTRAQVVKQKKLPPELKMLLDRADQLCHDKKFHSAEKAYLQVLKVDHKNIVAYRRLGQIYSILKNYEDAIESFQIAAQLAPSATSYQALAHALFDNKNYIKAIAAFEKAIMFEPTAALYSALGNTYQQMHNLPQAIAAYEKSLNYKPDKLHLQMLAEAYVANHERAKAEGVYKRILEIDPTDVKARRMVGAATVVNS